MLEFVKKAMSGNDQDVSSKRLVGVLGGFVAYTILLCGCVAIFFGYKVESFCLLSGVAGGISGGALGFAAWESRAKTTIVPPPVSTPSVTPTPTVPVTTSVTPPVQPVTPQTPTPSST